MTKLRQVQVRYFAALREQARCGDETVATEARTPAELYRELRRRHGFSLPLERLRVAMDDDFVAWDTPLKPDTPVAFLPPIAGG
jgi:molybdopterin converting factor small subunit